MVLEVAQIEVKAGLETEFETGVAKSADLFKRAKGCKSMRLERSIENPNLYFLVVGMCYTAPVIWLGLGSEERSALRGTVQALLSRGKPAGGVRVE